MKMKMKREETEGKKKGAKSSKQTWDRRIREMVISVFSGL
jgi:hypothetical protein